MELKSKNQKGQLNGLSASILALVFSAIILVLGLVVTSELVDTRDGTVTATVATNETLTVSGAGITTEVVSSDTCGYTGWTPTAVYNDTDNGNQTLVVTTDYLVNANGSLMNVTYWENPIKVTYTYTWGGEACVDGNKTIVGLGTFADFWEIIVLAIVISIVIGLLLVVFGGRRAR